jgi:adenylosuccinate synthase
LDGWWEDISKARSEADLPDNARRYIARIEELCGARISVVGVGPGREENVHRHPLI